MEVSAKQLRHLGMREAPACPVCHRKDWRYVKYEGADPLKIVYVLATCSCHTQMLWRSSLRLWQKVEPDKMVVVNG